MKKAIVAYFSASGITQKLANEIAQISKASLYEIQPMEKYTEEDLNWRNANSRSSKEMTHKQIRPSIMQTPFPFEECKVIFLAFPIWWYVAPTIINTFLEAHDFSEKTVVLFATSGSSKFGDTVKELQNSVSPSTHLLEGKVYNRLDERKDLQEKVLSFL